MQTIIIYITINNHKSYVLHIIKLVRRTLLYYTPHAVLPRPKNSRPISLRNTTTFPNLPTIVVNY